jgi:dTDP-4-amino-4,6-dideoxygalactose transaminase
MVLDAIRSRGATHLLGLGAGTFHHAERLARQSLSLPMYPELTSDQIGTVTGAIREFFDGFRTRS